MHLCIAHRNLCSIVMGIAIIRLGVNPFAYKTHGDKPPNANTPRHQLPRIAALSGSDPHGFGVASRSLSDTFESSS
jgi:hypothetical protein